MVNAKRKPDKNFKERLTLSLSLCNTFKCFMTFQCFHLFHCVFRWLVLN